MRSATPRSRADAPDRLLFLASSAEEYGADRMLVQSVRAVVEDYEVTVVLPTEGPLHATLCELGASVILRKDYVLRRKYLRPTAAPGLLWRNLVLIAFLLRQHRRDQYRVVVTNTEAVVAGALFAKARGIAHLWHIHEILAEPPTFARLMAALVDRLSDRVITCSASARDHVMSLRPALRGRCEAVLNGVEIPATPHRTQQEVARIGCVGRIAPRKGQRELLEAFALLADEGAPPTHLHFFGDVYPGNEWLLAELRHRVDELDIDDLVTFHGFVSDATDIYLDLDLVVVPSTDPEAFSLVCAEAQAHALAVIGPDRAGPAEIVVDGVTGLLVDTRDIAALRNAMARMLDHPPEREQFGRAGRERARELFTLDRYRRQFADNLGATIEARAGREPSRSTKRAPRR